MKIMKDVYVVGGGEYGIGLSHPLDCNVFLLDCGDEAVLIDAGVGRETERILRNAEAEGIPRKRIRRLFLTHGHLDHSGGAHALREACGAEVCMSEAEADSIEKGDEEAIGLAVARRSGVYPPDFRLAATAVQRRLSHGEKLTLGRFELQVLATPGHSRGSLCFLVNGGEKRMLFCGDTVFLRGLISLQNLPDSSLSDYKVGIRRLADLSVDSLFPSHFGFTINYGQAHINMASEALNSLGIPRMI